MVSGNPTQFSTYDISAELANKQAAGESVHDRALQMLKQSELEIAKMFPDAFANGYDGKISGMSQLWKSQNSLTPQEKIYAQITNQEKVEGANTGFMSKVGEGFKYLLDKNKAGNEIKVDLSDLASQIEAAQEEAIMLNDELAQQNSLALMRYFESSTKMNFGAPKIFGKELNRTKWDELLVAGVTATALVAFLPVTLAASGAVAAIVGGTSAVGLAEHLSVGGRDIATKRQAAVTKTILQTATELKVQLDPNDISNFIENYLVTQLTEGTDVWKFWQSNGGMKKSIKAALENYYKGGHGQAATRGQLLAEAQVRKTDNESMVLQSQNQKLQSDLVTHKNNLQSLKARLAAGGLDQNRSAQIQAEIEQTEQTLNRIREEIAVNTQKIADLKIQAQSYKREAMVYKDGKDRLTVNDKDRTYLKEQIGLSEAGISYIPGENPSDKVDFFRDMAHYISGYDPLYLEEIFEWDKSYSHFVGKQAEKEAVFADIKEYETAITASAAKTLAAQTTVAETHKTISGLQKDITSLEFESRTITGAIDNKVAEKTKLEATLRAMNDTTTAADTLRQSIASLNDEITKLKAKLNDKPNGIIATIDSKKTDIETALKESDYTEAQKYIEVESKLTEHCHAQIGLLMVQHNEIEAEEISSLRLTKPLRDLFSGAFGDFSEGYTASKEDFLHFAAYQRKQNDRVFESRIKGFQRDTNNPLTNEHDIEVDKRWFWNDFDVKNIKGVFNHCKEQSDPIKVDLKAKGEAKVAAAKLLKPNTPSPLSFMPYSPLFTGSPSTSTSAVTAVAPSATKKSPIATKIDGARKLLEKNYKTKLPKTYAELEAEIDQFLPQPITLSNEMLKTSYSHLPASVQTTISTFLSTSDNNQNLGSFWTEFQKEFTLESAIPLVAATPIFELSYHKFFDFLQTASVKHSLNRDWTKNSSEAKKQVTTLFTALRNWQNDADVKVAGELPAKAPNLEHEVTDYEWSEHLSWNDVKTRPNLVASFEGMMQHLQIFIETKYPNIAWTTRTEAEQWERFGKFMQKVGVNNPITYDNINDFYDIYYQNTTTPYEATDKFPWEQSTDATKQAWIDLTSSMDYFLTWGLKKNPTPVPPPPPPDTDTEEDETEENGNDDPNNPTPPSGNDDDDGGSDVTDAEEDSGTDGNGGGGGDTPSDDENLPSENVPPGANENSTEHDTSLDSIDESVEIPKDKRCIYFEGENQSTLSTNAKKSANLLARSIASHMASNAGTYKILVESFCTTTDAEKNNTNLAQKRSQSTINFLSNKGLNSSNMIMNASEVGLADFSAEEWNASAEGRNYNEQTGGEPAATYTNLAVGAEESATLAKTRHKNRRSSIRLFKQNDDGSTYTEVDFTKKKV